MFKEREVFASIIVKFHEVASEDPEVMILISSSYILIAGFTLFGYFIIPIGLAARAYLGNDVSLKNSVADVALKLAFSFGNSVSSGTV